MERFTGLFGSWVWRLSFEGRRQGPSGLPRVVAAHISAAWDGCFTVRRACARVLMLQVGLTLAGMGLTARRRKA